jgi:hypothetical protein
MEDMNIQEQLDKLFKRWLQASINNGDGKRFCKDGIPYKYGHSRGYEEELWFNAKKKVLVLVKDQYQDNNPDNWWDDDAREWFDHLEKDKKQYYYEKPFFKNIAYTLQAILNPDKEYTGDLDVKAVIDTTPFAYVEAKKQPGKDSCPPNIFSRFLNKYRDYIKEEITDILKPDIIVNCCGDPVGWNFVNKEIFADSPNKQCYKNDFDSKKRETVIYYKEQQKLHIMLPHPSTRGISRNPKYFFDFVMHPYTEFLKDYPDWLK